MFSFSKKVFVSRLLLFLGVLVLSASLTSLCEAKAKEGSQAKAAAAKEQARKNAAAKRRELKEIGRARLAGTAWEVTLKPLKSNPDKNEVNDIITFGDDKVHSKWLLDKEFPVTNYSVRVKELKGTEAGKMLIIWETMQTSQDKGIAFWRGELINDRMSGVLSWHIDDENKKDYSFSGEAKAAAAPEPVVPVVEEVVVEEEVVEVVPPSEPETSDETVLEVKSEEKEPEAEKKEEPKKSKKKKKKKKRGRW